MEVKNHCLLDPVPLGIASLPLLIVLEDPCDRCQVVVLGTLVQRSWWLSISSPNKQQCSTSLIEGHPLLIHSDKTVAVALSIKKKLEVSPWQALPSLILLPCLLCRIRMEGILLILWTGTGKCGTPNMLRLLARHPVGPTRLPKSSVSRAILLWVPNFNSMAVET